MIIFSTIADERFQVLKQAIESYPRLCGYYINDVVSIEELRQNGYTQEVILDKIIDYFDDDLQENTPVSIPNDQSRADYEVLYREAKCVTIEALVGGSSIGHTINTIPASKAEQYFENFVDLFESDRKYYVGLGIGNRNYVFQHGILAVDNQKAGILWIVESD